MLPLCLLFYRCPLALGFGDLKEPVIAVAAKDYLSKSSFTRMKLSKDIKDNNNHVQHRHLLFAGF